MNVNESNLLFRLLRKESAQGLMLDVGAHRGGACLQFMEEGWSVHAFEPDPANREHLLKLAERFPLLRVDPRAISDRSRQGVAFFTSAVSSGISGLSRFHESHKETACVDTVSLEEFCEKEGVERVDFLGSLRKSVGELIETPAQIC